MRAAADGSYRVVLSVRDTDAPVPATGPLRVVLGAKDPRRLEYQGATASCRRTSGGRLALRCSASP